MVLAEKQNQARFPRIVWVSSCFLIIAAIIAAWIAIDAKPKVLADLSVDDGKFVVVGKAGNKVDVLIKSWAIELWWNRNGELWACYSLDYESSLWKDVSIDGDGDHLLVKKRGKVAANLNLKDGSLENLERNTHTVLPAFLTKGEPLKIDHDPRIYPESAN